MQLDCILNETVVRNYGTFSNTMKEALSPVHHNQTDDGAEAHDREVLSSLLHAWALGETSVPGLARLKLLFHTGRLSQTFAWRSLHEQYDAAAFVKSPEFERRKDLGKLA
ncbi:hypothetical protein E4U59_005167, partial [Claviceps monticola]